MTTSARLHHLGTALIHPLSPSAWRNSMRLRPADALLAPAIKVGIAATLVLVAGGLLGQQQLAAIAALGALTSAFGRYQSYGRMGRQLAVVAAGLLSAAGVGALLATVGTPLWLQIAVLSLIAGGSAHLFTALGITGPGPVILVFAASAGAGYAHSPTEIVHVLAAVGIGSLVGWAVAVAPVLVFPLAPARLATARAIAAVGRLGRDGTGMHDDGGRNSAAAKAAIANARTTIALSIRSRTGQSARTAALLHQAQQLSALMDEAEAALAVLDTPAFPAALATLARHEAALRTFRRAPEFTAGTAGNSQAAAPAKTLRAVGRAGLASRASLHQALRMTVAAALAGWVAVALGLGHPLWASMGAVATLQGLNYSISVQRGIQRLVGNVLGALVAVALLSLSLGFWPSAAIVVLLQVAAELLVLRNYTLTTIAVTPMALIMTGMGSPLGADAAVNRVADTLVGVVLGLLVAAVSISRSDTHHLPAGAARAS